MGKKYYCDYCEKTLPDNLESRKKHNMGLVHQKLKQAHFTAHMDLKTKLCEELAKGPCKRFQQGMECRFGNDCRFSHFFPHEIETLRITSQQEEFWKMKLPRQLMRKREPDINEFVRRMEVLSKEKEKTSSPSSEGSSTLKPSDYLPLSDS